MPLPAVVDSLEGVEEPVRKFYTEVKEGELAGHFVLDADITGHPKLTSARAESVGERKKRQTAEASLKAFQDLGYTPEQIAEIKRKAEEHGGEKDPDKLVEKRVKAVRDEFEPVVTERDTLKAENRRLKLTDKVRADFIAAGGFEEDADDVVRLTEATFDLDDKGRPVVLDDEGDPTGQSPKEWFEKVYKKKKPKVFKGSVVPGSGARGGDGGAGAGDLEKLSPTQRLTEARRRGLK